MKWQELAAGFMLIEIFAASPAAADAIADCYASAPDRASASACVAKVVADSQHEVDEVLAKAKEVARKLDQATGRSEALPALLSSQAAFDAYREATCRKLVPAVFQGGSGEGQAMAACLVESDVQRVRWLAANVM